MSDAPVPRGTEAEPGPGTEAPETSATQQPEPQPEPVDYLEIDDELASKHVKVTVDGEETSVPLSELTQGYSRQADYTRKTQELADQRKEAEAALQLQRAFQANPGMTVQILADRQGMSVQEFLGLSQQQQQAAVQQATQQEPDYQDPLEQQLQQSNQRLQTLEEQIAQERADRELRSSVDGLRQQYQASDEEVREVVNTAMRYKMPFQAFPMIYQSLAFQKAQTQQQTRQDAGQQQTAQEQARQQAAAAAGGVISQGTGATGTTPDPATQGTMSYADAINTALDKYE